MPGVCRGGCLSFDLTGTLSQTVKQIYTSKISVMNNDSMFLLSMGMIRHDLYKGFLKIDSCF